jgi:hypothetical protein
VPASRTSDDAFGEDAAVFVIDVPDLAADPAVRHHLRRRLGPG